MEIISYLKGKKAQQQAKSLQEVIGQDAYKHGPKDVIDTFTNADERIGDLEMKSNSKTLSTKIDELTKKTAIELNKNAIRIGSFQKAQKFNHTNLVFENFNTDTSIDMTNSSNIKVNQTLGLIQSVDKNKEAVVVLKKMEVQEAAILILSFQGYGATSFEYVLNLDEAELINIEKTNGIFRLKKIKEVEDHEQVIHEVFESEGQIKFSGIVLKDKTDELTGFNQMSSGLIDVRINETPFEEGMKIDKELDISFLIKSELHDVVSPLSLNSIDEKHNIQSISAPIQLPFKKQFNIFSNLSEDHNILTNGNEKYLSYQRYQKKEFNKFEIVAESSVSISNEEKYIQLGYVIY